MPHPGFLLLEEGTDDYLLLEEGSPDRLLLEAYYEVETEIRSPVDWAAPLIASAQHSVAFSGPISNSMRTMVEWDGTKQVLSFVRARAEWSGVVGAVTRAPVAFTGVLQSITRMPVYKDQPGFGMVESAPVSWSGSMAMESRAPVSFSGVAQSSVQFPLEISAELSGGAGLPVEWDGYGTVRAFAMCPLELTRDVAGQADCPVAFGGLFSAETSIPVTWGVQLPALVHMHAEWGVEVGGAGVDGLPVHFLASPGHDEAAPVFIGGNVAQNSAFSFPVEIRAGVNSTAESPVFWSGFTTVVANLPVGWGATVSRVAEMPVEVGKKVLAGDTLAVEKLAGVLASVDAPVEIIQDGMLLYMQGVECVWVLTVIPPASDTWGQDGCK